MRCYCPCWIGRYGRRMGEFIRELDRFGCGDGSRLFSRMACATSLGAYDIFDDSAHSLTITSESHEKMRNKKCASIRGALFTSPFSTSHSSSTFHSVILFRKVISSSASFTFNVPRFSFSCSMVVAPMIGLVMSQKKLLILVLR
jgi:hypothetical protein